VLFSGQEWALQPTLLCRRPINRARYHRLLHRRTRRPLRFHLAMNSTRTPLQALNLVLGSVEAVRNLRALYMLLATFASAGLLLSMAEASLARADSVWGAVQAGLALFAAFYGANAAGLLMMDDARGLPVRDVVDAVRASLFSAHRLLLVLLIVGTGYAVLGSTLWLLLWLCRTEVTGAVLGPALFGLVVPIGVISVGLALLALVAVVVPMAAPSIWSGAGVWLTVRRLLDLMRRRLLTVALLFAAVSGLTAAMGALVTAVVMVGGRVIAEAGVTIVGVQVPAQQLMAGLFGYGLRSLGAAGAPMGGTGHAATAVVGGGLVFALALVLPSLVYLRGTCAVYLALHDDAPA
jgi:hypothetical protein